ncbi:MAG: hypothetical protein J6T34_00280 [Bacilli bacterium]|nr:hypothetical protein [Bacilli bacterium]
MLNKEGNRELAYVVKIDNIEEIVGSDNCEAAVVGGWKIMTRKNTFKPGDLAIYFEIDSHVDTNKPEFAFLAPKHGNVKTQKYTFGGKNPGFYSQGLLMSAEDFGGVCYQDGSGLFYLHFGKDSFFKENIDYGEGEFLTNQLGVTYAVAEDNKRKAKSNPDARINAALSRHPAIAKKYGKIIKKNKFLRWLFMFLFGRKSDKKREWPTFVKKTDEERVQNLAHLVPEFAKEQWVATEKIDGTSTTFAIKRGKRHNDYYVCSRNVVMNQPGKEKTCYYAQTDGNVYTEMSEKYDMEKVLNKMLADADKNVNSIVIQAETYGGSIQKRNYHLKEHDMAIFNIIYNYEDGTSDRLNPIEGAEFAKNLGLPYVPVIGIINIPDTCDGILALAGGPSKLDGDLREGLVFRSMDGVKSFKAVDNAFLVKYHQ